jgi:hypothetical protein
MNLQRIFGTIAVAALVGSFGAAPAPGQDGIPDTQISTKATAIPSKAGTKRHPRGLAIRASAKIRSEPGYERPIVTGLDILVGKGLVWNADDYVRCSKPVLDRKGPRGCPRKSIAGHAKITGMADTVPARAEVTFFNGGWNRTFAYVTLYNPALVKETVVVRRTKMKGRWAHRESLRVPTSLQIVAGVPIQMTDATMRIGGQRYAREYITSTSCPKGGWRYRVTAHYLHATGDRGPGVTNGRIRCRR